MTGRSGPPAGDATASLVTWLVTGAVGPALVALPVNWVADKVASAAVRWFKRLRKTDDLSHLVKAAAGQAIHLSNDEFRDLRALLEKQQTWELLAGGPLDELVGKIAECVPRLTRDATAAIARGLVEFAVFELEPPIFQKVVQARLGQMTSHASALDEALFRMHKDLYHLVDEVQGLFAQVSDRLPPGPADLGEVKIYLKALSSWLNADPWPQDSRLRGSALAPAVIEQNPRISVGQRFPDGDEPAGGWSRLVILGGPGTGKTWLAMRIARKSAEEALNRLDDDASLDEVELPLYTTCSRLIGAQGDIREAIVSSALNWIGDLGGSRITGGLRIRFAERDSSTLLVIDSLDEASDPGLARDRVRQVDSLAAPWRVVLTSRPSSWNGQFAIDGGSREHLVGELQPLRYPWDVEPVVMRWFAGDPERSQALIAQLAQRPSLQRAATVPLILAFYCILGGAQPLPEFRHKLHEQVINRLLRGPWRSSIGALPDAGACRETLRSWAWRGAVSDQLSGVGQWEDDVLTPDAQLSVAGQVAVDHIAAPMAGPDFDTDQTPRRFVHRSIREHLVAEYVAGLRASEAVDALLPHLWYDADWEYAAPTAIAMHPDHDAVLRALLLRAGNSDAMPMNISAIDGGGEIRILLARVATESKEIDWSPELAEIIGQARVDLARHAIVRDLGEATYWPVSNGRVCEVMSELLAQETDDQERERLAMALAQLDPARRDEHLAKVPPARAALKRLDAMFQSHVTGGMDRELGITFGPVRPAGAATRPDPAAHNKEQVKETLMKLRDPAIDGWEAYRLASALPAVEQADEDVYLTRQAVLARLVAETDIWQIADFAGALTALNPTEADKLQARQVVCEWLARKDDLQIPLPEELVPLGPTVADLRTWRSWGDPPPTELLAAVRRNSTLDEWVESLPSFDGLMTWRPATP